MIVRRLHPHFIGEVIGIDTGQPIDVPAVQDAIDELAVLVFRGQQNLSDDAQIAFSALFGPVTRSITVHREDTTRRLKRDELSDISNVSGDGSRLAADDRKRLLQRPARLWHTDSSFRIPVGRYTFLAARLLPPEGGNTQFADCRAAYDSLPEATKVRIERLEVVHSLARSRTIANAPALSEQEAANLSPTVQPLVRVHPGSGRKALYLGSHAESIVGWPQGEGRALLDELEAQIVRPEFVYNHIWKPGDLVMWDNRCTLHRATPFREDLYVRDMRRTTVADG